METGNCYEKYINNILVRVEVFPYHVDRIVNSRARKPIIPLDAEILAIGIGPTFLESYKKKYKVK